MTEFLHLKTSKEFVCNRAIRGQKTTTTVAHPSNPPLHSHSTRPDTLQSSPQTSGISETPASNAITIACYLKLENTSLFYFTGRHPRHTWINYS